MSKNDLLMLAAGFALVTILATLAVLFPAYRVYEGSPAEGHTFVRRPIWDPPNLYLNRQFHQSREELEQLAETDPQMREFIEHWNAQPRRPEHKAQPIFINTRGSNPNKDRNLFGTLAFFSVAAYFVFAIFKWQNRG